MVVYSEVVRMLSDSESVLHCKLKGRFQGLYCLSRFVGLYKKKQSDQAKVSKMQDKLHPSTFYHSLSRTQGRRGVGAYSSYLRATAKTKAKEVKERA